MYTVSFYYLYNCVIDVNMRIIWFLLNSHQDLRGKCTLTSGKNRENMKEPGGPYQIGKALRALFSRRKVYSRGLHRITIQHGSELMIRPILRDCAKYARGPPEWIRTDSLFGSRTGKVNQIWFTPTPRPNTPCVGQMLRTAHGRDTVRKPAVWRVCGAVERREPYNLLPESKTYYTQNYDNMR